MSTLKANVVQSATGGATTLTDLYPARAWSTFVGTGTVSITVSGNVSSITDYGGGNYGINFSSAFGSSNYCATGDAQTNDGYDGRGRHEPESYSTSQVRIWTCAIRNIQSAQDSPRVMTTVTL